MIIIPWLTLGLPAGDQLFPELLQSLPRGQLIGGWQRSAPSVFSNPFLVAAVWPDRRFGPTVPPIPMKVARL